MQSSLTTTQILGLAPDRVIANSCELLAVPDRWDDLGRCENMVWGTFPNKNRSPFHTQIDLSQLILNCSCAVYKTPCRHSMALLLMQLEQPQAFVDKITPSTVTQWRLKQRKQNNQTSSKTHHATQTTAVAKRQARVKEGMAELERWLRDMVQHGLADLPAKPKKYWLQMRARLIDAQADEIARDLRHISELLGKQPDWPDEVLRRIGRLYLLTQGFRQFDTLSPQTQADLRAAVGWFTGANNTKGYETVADDWLIMGHQNEQRGKRQMQYSWLWGQHSQRPALVVRVLRKHSTNAFCLPTGATIAAELAFYPSQTPLYAELVTDKITFLASIQSKASQTSQENPTDIKNGIAAYAHALTHNPWLRRFPLFLQATTPEFDGTNWVLRDSDGYHLPLPSPFLHGWHLLALSKQPDFMLFGEWNGRFLQPLSVCVNGRWLDLHILRGIK